MADVTARYPGRAPIDAYGNGGFRFADMSHRGSILCLPSGIYAWDAADPDRLTLADFAAALRELEMPGFLLLGTGRTQVFPALDIRRTFADAKVGLEPMDTGAACRTYNVLLAERRQVAAALIAVD
ncbi:MAG: Mth938-like domain-containing protein [Hyphomicrobiaceae bacterium]